jgi:RNA polymerase sigma-70 factor, ECF subfamily
MPLLAHRLLRMGRVMPAPSPATSVSLIDQACAGQPAAWQRLVSLYAPLLRSWLTTAGLQPADRDDLSQRVLEILVRQLPRFEHNGRPGAFRAWLRGITVNLLREHWRNRPQAGTDSVLEQLADPAGSLSRLWDEQHDRHVLRALMEQVRPEFSAARWQAFCRVSLDGVPARVAAEELGMSVNAVLIARSRILARLRQEAEGLID